jgi:hypothetical protein
MVEQCPEQTADSRPADTMTLGKTKINWEHVNQEGWIYYVGRCKGADIKVREFDVDRPGRSRASRNNQQRHIVHGMEAKSPDRYKEYEGRKLADSSREH